MNSDRKLVSELIKQVLISRVSVREAIVRFPRDTEDKSIQAAFHALIHYEADEKFRINDPLYRDEQDEYLELIADILADEKDLPNNIIKAYEKYYPEPNMLHEKNFSGFLKGFLKFLG